MWEVLYPKGLGFRCINESVSAGGCLLLTSSFGQQATVNFLKAFVYSSPGPLGARAPRSLPSPEAAPSPGLPCCHGLTGGGGCLAGAKGPSGPLRSLSVLCPFLLLVIAPQFIEGTHHSSTLRLQGWEGADPISSSKNGDMTQA